MREHVTTRPQSSIAGRLLQYVRTIRAGFNRTIGGHECEFPLCGCDRVPGSPYCAFHKRKLDLRRSVRCTNGPNVVTPFRGGMALPLHSVHGRAALAKAGLV